MAPSEESVRITSELSADCRDELERLLFFNEQQGAYRRAVIQSVDEFGEPFLRVVDGRLRVLTTRLGEVQTLFAVRGPAETARPIAVAVYARTSPDTITLIHVGTDADHAVTGPFAREMVMVRLVQAIARAASGIKDVERVIMPYGSARSVTIALPVRRQRHRRV
jgi:hypothetical protein